MTYIYNMTDTWNNGATVFTAIKMNVTNTASAAGSLLMDLQVGGTSGFNVDKNGYLRIASTTSDGIFLGDPTPGGALPGIWFGSNAASGTSSYTNYSFLYDNAAGNVIFNAQTGATEQHRVANNTVWLSDINGPRLGSGINLSWSSNANPALAAADLFLYRDAANTLAQRNSTNAQTFCIYNTYTDASNYERLYVGWSANIAYFVTQSAGTGIGRDVQFGAGSSSTLSLISNNAVRWAINLSGHLTAGTDNTYDIGISNTSRPRNIYAASAIESFGSFYCGNDTGNYYLGVSNDVVLTRDAANTLAQRNGTSAQTFRIYNTYSGGGSNYERLTLGWSGNVTQILTEAAGTGTLRPLTFPLGTVTASTPFTVTQTWNNAGATFTGMKLNITNTASNSGSLLFDLEVGGTSVMYVRADGYTVIGAAGANEGVVDIGTAPHRINANSNNLVISNGSTGIITFNVNSGSLAAYTMTSAGSSVLFNGAIATNATDGFLYIAGGAGAPTGVPSSFTGRYPLYWDHTNKKLYIYDGAWLGGTAPGTWS